MKNQRKGLLSNCFFLLKYTFGINRPVIFLRLSRIILDVISPFIPIFFLRLILNEISVGQDIGKLLLFVSLFAVSAFVKDLLLAIINRFSAEQTDTAVRKIKNNLGIFVMEMPYSDAEQPKVRDFIKLAEDSTNFSAVLDRFAGIISSVITIIGLGAIITSLNPILFAPIAAVVAFRLIADGKNRKLTEKYRSKYSPIMRQIGYLFRVMKSIEYGKEVRINRLQDWVFSKAQDNKDVYLKTAKKHNVEISKNNVTSSAASIIQEIVSYFVLAYEVIFQGMTIGDFSMYLSSVTSFSNNVSSIVGAITQFMETGVFVRDFRYCIELAEKSRKQEAEGKVEFNSDKIDIEFKNVSFKYPGTDRFILRNISLRLTSGRSISIVGVNGAGKTTLVKLLCRLYSPTKGSILINGRDIQSYAYDDYIKLIGAVFQDFKLFSLSVGENVAVGSEADSERIKTCLVRSGLEEKLNSLPEGQKTNISKEFDQNGIEFSGGEGQKLVLARALYKKAPVLILDEPASALDPIAESEIYSRFHSITKDKATIYISHRLSSCRFCDEIVVLDGGVISEHGTHDELMALKGVYLSMWNMQAQYYA